MKTHHHLSKFIGGLVAILLLADISHLLAAGTSEEEIHTVLLSQQQSWNRGDLDAFMNGYARSEETVFISGDEVTRGWQTVLDHYKKKYSDRQKMGTLTFSEFEIKMLGETSATALGRWELELEGKKDRPHGRFTLIFRKMPEGWRIVQDHTSSAN